MVIRPYKKFRPAKTDPGDGTFVEGAATQSDIYGTVILHKGETQMIVSRHVDVLVGDLLELDAGNYRVFKIERTSSAPRMNLKLERTRKPIRPLLANDSVTALSYESMSEAEYEDLTEAEYEALVEG